MDESGGWVKLHKKTLKSPVVMKDADHLAIWTYLLMKAAYKDYDVLFGGKRITLHPGQLTITIGAISNELSVGYEKTKNVLREFEAEGMIARNSTRHGTLVTIANWCKYQETENPYFTQSSPLSEPTENRPRTDQPNAENPENIGKNATRCENEKPYFTPNRTNQEPTENRPRTAIKEYIEYKNNNNLSLTRARDDPYEKPTLDDVKEFCRWRGLHISPETFFNYYEARGWKIGGQPIENWKAQAIIWDDRDKTKRKHVAYQNKFNQIESHEYNMDELERTLLGE